jgi:hypothetical protein
MSVEDKLNYRLEIIHFKQTDGRTKWQLYAPPQNISGSIKMRCLLRFRFRFIVFNATFNNISTIYISVLLVEEKDPEKTTDLSQVTDKLYNISSQTGLLKWNRII